MKRRTKIALRIAELVGPTCAITSAGDGWPALADIRVNGDVVPVALFVSAVGLSHRNRDDVERRYQNPDKSRPIVQVGGRLLVLVGLWESDSLVPVQRPVLACADAYHRLGLQTRHSVFFHVQTLQLAAVKGWAEDESSSEEKLYCLVPSLFPAYVDMLRSGVAIPPSSMQTVVDAAGLFEEEPSAAAERARRASNSLIREARFGRTVVEAYGGLCAMCGLNLGLVEGAHIYPVSAPNSPDKTWNGLALCGNHHAAFDKHKIWVHPETRKISIHPELHGRKKNATCERFLKDTAGALAEPPDPLNRPRAEMFSRRYAYYEKHYTWISG